MNRRELLQTCAMLLGGVASAAVSRAVMAAVPLNRGLSATVFDPDQRKTVELLSEMIIPATDTPGAMAAGVPDFIAQVVAEWYNEAERAVFFRGLKALDTYCLAAESKVFLAASEACRIAALSEQEQVLADYKSQHTESGGHPLAPRDDDALPFFGKLKELVVVGFYTSEVGAKEELEYHPMPGHYDGDVDYTQVGRRFSA